MGEKGTCSGNYWEEEVYGPVHQVGAAAQWRWTRRCLSVVAKMRGLVCDGDMINYTIII